MSVKKVAPWELQPPSNGPGITRSDAAQNGMIWYSQDLLAVLVHTCHSTLTMHKIHNSHISIYMSHINIYILFWFFSCQTSSLSCFGTEGGAAENIQYPTMHTSNQTRHDLEPQDILRLFVLPMPSNVEAYPMLLVLLALLWPNNIWFGVGSWNGWISKIYNGTTPKEFHNPKSLVH